MCPSKIYVKLFICFQKYLENQLRISKFIAGCFTEGVKAPKHYISSKREEYEIPNVSSEYECQAKHCRLYDNCHYFAFVPSEKICYLKSKDALNVISHEKGVIFGPKICEGSLFTLLLDAIKFLSK